VLLERYAAGLAAVGPRPASIGKLARGIHRSADLAEIFPERADRMQYRGHRLGSLEKD
jgi:hypothetical protein